MNYYYIKKVTNSCTNRLMNQEAEIYQILLMNSKYSGIRHTGCQLFGLSLKSMQNYVFMLLKLSGSEYSQNLKEYNLDID